MRWIGLLFALLTVTSCAAKPFGRFGRIHNDGLLTLNVTPNSVAFPVALGGFTLHWTVPKGGPQVLAIAPDHKVLFAKTADGPNQIEYSLAFPGITLRFGTRGRFLLRMQDWQIVRREGLGRATIYDTYEVRGHGGQDQPLSPALWLQVRKGVSLEPGRDSITLRGKRGIGEVRLLTPSGIRSLEENPNDEAIAAIGLSHQLSKSYRRVGNDWLVTEKWSSRGGRAICPISPMLWFAIRHGYPARIDGKVVESGVLTKWGTFAYVQGNVLRYRLPAVPDGERRPFGRELTNDESDLARSLVDDLAMKWAENAVDLGYSRLAPILLMGDLAPSAMRAAALANLRPESALLLPPYAKTATVRPWKQEVEPFTRSPYLYTYFIRGEGPYRYDIEWGNALPVYGLWQAAKDDPARLRKLWPSAKRVLNYLELGHDWAWMTVVNADHGFSTGTGDAMCAAYAGTVAATKIARRIGDAAGERKYGFMAAEMAVAMCSRLVYTDFARVSGQVGPQSLVLGFHETEGFTRVLLGSSDPWGPATLLSGSGCMPEVLELYAKFAQADLRWFLDTFAKAYPQWYVGDHSYPFETTYSGNGGYVTFPIWYAHLMLGADRDWLGHCLKQMAVNRTHAWVGTNALAEFWSQLQSAFITSASGAAIRRLWMPSETEATITLVPDRRLDKRGHRLVSAPAKWQVHGALRTGWRLVGVVGATLVERPGEFTLSGTGFAESPKEIRLQFARR